MFRGAGRFIILQPYPVVAVIERSRSMGSFANSLHVKCDDAERVKAAIESLLADKGWSATDELPDEPDARFGVTPTRRALFVSAPLGGWVSILDSDLMGESQLAADLARQLDTYALLVMVNDSDSWYYTLHRGARQLDEFESEMGDDDFDESPGDLEGLTASLNSLQKMMSDGSLMQRMAEVQQQIEAKMPPEMQDIRARAQIGKATSEELMQFQDWFSRSNPLINEQIEQLVGTVLPGGALGRLKQQLQPKPGKRKAAKADKATRERLERLRPLLAKDADDEEVEEVFAVQATFAEETLADFLPLVGIPGYYAYLSYGYLEESTPAELAQHSIRFVHHLKYLAPDS
jgi:hypothetical protein